MPYSGEHACRLENPDKYDSFARKNCAEKHDSKCIDVIYGIKDNKSEIQALRYDKKIWTESDARAHCKTRDGSFEAAEKSEGSMKLEYRTEVNARAVAGILKRPLDSFNWFEIKAQTEDETEIFIYDYIGWPFNDAGEFVRAIVELKEKAFTVRINSPGGDVFDAMAIYNALAGHDAKVTTRGEALTASAASIVLLAGKEVQAYKNNMLMIHDPWMLVAGNRFDLRDTADILDKISDNMVDIYSQNSDVGKKEMRDMLKNETWMTAKEAKEKGFIDMILDGKAPKAAFDLSMFANVPDGLRPEGKEKPSKRDLEYALREAGLSQSQAKAVLAGGCAAIESDEERLIEISTILKTTISNFGG